MDMRFGTWLVKSLYRAGSLPTVAKVISKCKLDLVAKKKSDGTGVPPNQQANIRVYFSVGRGMRIMNYV
jgi:hypothetical protein